MSCQDSCRPTPKCNCCENCIRKQIAKMCQKRQMEEQIYQLRQLRTRDGCTQSCHDPSPIQRSNRDDYPIPPKRNHSITNIRTLNFLKEKTQGFQHHRDELDNGTDNEYHDQEDRSPTRKTAHNIDYKPQSNFLRKMKGLTQEIPTVSDGPGACCCPRRRGQAQDDTGFEASGRSAKTDEDSDHRRRASSLCGCCKCDHSVQNSTSPSPAANHRMIFREKVTPCSELSSIHDPCMCYRTWRPQYHGDDYDFDVGRELNFRHGDEEDDDYCDAYDSPTPFDHELGGEYDSDVEHCDQDENGTIRPKRGKSHHVSRDKRRRRARRRKCTKKTCEESLIDFEPSLKRPHPNSCERCWRYASPSRSPVNKPSQRFDPNYRRSHSQMILPGSEQESSDAESRYIEFDPETKVHELMGQFMPRVKSVDDVKKAKVTRPGTAKCPNSREGPRPSWKQQSKVGSTQTNGVFFDFTQSPVQCSPSMFDKASQRSSVHSKHDLKSSTPKSPSQKATRFGSRPASSSAYERSSPRSSMFEKSTPKASSPGKKTPRSGKTSTAGSMASRKSKDRPSSASSPRPENRETPTEVSGSCHHAKSHRNHRSEPVPCGSRLEGPRRQGCKALSQHAVSEKGGRPGPCCLHSRGDMSEPNRTPVTLWDRKGSRAKQPPCCGHQPHVEESGQVDRERETNGERGRGARKYCVFYMTRGKEPREEDAIEVFIEEVGEEESCNGTEKKAQAARERVQKIREPKMESMALKFQKGVGSKCRRRAQEDRVLYF